MDSPLNRWLRALYKEKTGILPDYPPYTMAQAFLGLKAAYEKARQARLGQPIPTGGNKAVKEELDSANSTSPSQDEIIAAFESITFEGPSGQVQMKLGKGHQAVQGTAVGTTRSENGQIKVGNVKYYAAERVQPPEGMTSVEWIKAGMKLPWSPPASDTANSGKRLAQLLGLDPDAYGPGHMTHDLRRLRLHRLIERVPRSHRYRMTRIGAAAAQFYVRFYARALRPSLSLSLGTHLRRGSSSLSHLEHAVNKLLHEVHLAA